MNDFIDTLVYLFHSVFNKKYFIRQEKNGKIKISSLGNFEIPTRTEGINGRQNEPVNFIIVAKNNTIFEEFLEKTGFHLADPVTVWNSIKEFFAGNLGIKYPTGVMTPYFLNGAEQNYSIQKLTDYKTAKQRHHARFWKTNFKTKEGIVFLGITSLDAKMKWLITHKIDPNIDKEREFLFDQFKKTSLIRKSDKIKIVESLKGKIFNDDDFFSDGKAYLIYL